MRHSRVGSVSSIQNIDSIENLSSRLLPLSSLNLNKTDSLSKRIKYGNRLNDQKTHLNKCYQLK